MTAPADLLAASSKAWRDVLRPDLKHGEKHKHTPGPWTVNPGDSLVSVRTAAGERVAVTDTKAYFERHDETDLANARLIAAAPTMLEALQDVAKAMPLWLEGIEEDEGNYAIETTERVRAAIAKATGASDA